MDEGGYPIFVEEKRLQLFRHQPGQLESLKNLNVHEIDALRIA